MVPHDVCCDECSQLPPPSPAPDSPLTTLLPEFVRMSTRLGLRQLGQNGATSNQETEDGGEGA